MQNTPQIEEVKVHFPEGDLIEEIGVGGFKVVYKAHIKGKTEAIKLVLIPEGEEDEDRQSIREENILRIHREIQILSKCNSPHIVKLGSIAPRELKINENVYIMYSEEYVEGKNIRSIIKENQRPSFDELTILAQGLVECIQELWQMKVIHRDIKPENIIKTEHKKRPFILLDLGIAFEIGGTQITRDTARVPGTLYYIAPEMLELGFRQNIDYRADLYAAGLTIYEYASGINPYAKKGEPLYTTMDRIKTQNPAPLKTLRQDLPEEFCNLIDQLMKKIPALRPASFNNLLGKIGRYI